MPEAARTKPGRPRRRTPDAEAKVSQAIPNKIKRIAGRIRGARLCARQTDETAHAKRTPAYQAQEWVNTCST